VRIGRKKWIPLAAAGLLIILLVALYFFAAHIINSQWARSLAKTEIDKVLGGTVQFEEPSLEIFPRLCLRISRITFNRPGVASGTIRSVEICPRIWPLLRGEFRIAAAVLDTPDITTSPPARKEEPFSPEIIRTKIIPAFVEVSARSPGSTIKVVNGKLNVLRAGGNSYLFSGISLDAGINREELYLNLESTSSPWGSLLVRGRLPYSQDRLAAKDLNISAAECSLSGIEAALSWEDDVPIILADVNQAGIDLKNLQDWGVFSKVRTGWLKNINSMGGRVNLTSVHLNGPLLKPSAWDYSLSGDLDRVALQSVIAPQAFKLDTGRFNAAYDRKSAPESTIEIIDMQGNVGNSSFKNVSALFKGSYFKTGAAAINLDLNEIQKWRAFQEFRKKSLEDLASLTGSVHVENLQAEGPLGSPAKWHYDFSGSVDNLVFELSGAPYPFEVSQGDFSSTGSHSGKAFAFERVNGIFGNSRASGLSGKFRTNGAPHLEMSAGKSRLALSELQGWEILNNRLGRVTSVQGSVNLDFFRFAGTLTDIATWTYTANGTASNIILEVEDFPTSKIDGRFSLDQNTVSLEQAKASLLDTNLSLTGQVRILDHKFYAAVFDTAGTIGKSTVVWASQYQPIPEYVKVPSAISVIDARLEWRDSQQFSLKGLFTPEDGPRITLDLVREPLSWTVRQLLVKDEQTDARFTLKVAREGTDFSYSGNLRKATLDKLVVNDLEAGAFISGNLSGHIPAKSPLLASLTGRVQTGDIVVPLKNSSYPLKIKAITVKADPDTYVIESAEMSWGNQNFTTNGSLKRKGEVLITDLNVLTDLIVYERLMAMIAEMQSGEQVPESKPSMFWELPLRGNITISSDQFIIKKYVAHPFSVDISLGPRLVRLNFTKDFICGMPLPGTIDITPQGYSMNLHSVALNMDLAPVLACLMEQQTAASGRFDFSGEAKASGKLPETLTGEFTFTARNGLIYRARLLSSILEYLNITRIFVGKVPTIGAEGLPYGLFSIKGRIKGSIIEISEFEMRGPTLGLAGEGSIDLARNRVELTVLVSPLRTVDYLISRIPIVKYFFKGILAIPVGVYGNPSNPIIVPLDPSAIGAQIYSIMNRIIRAPFKLFESFK